MGKTELIIQEESIKFAALPSVGGDIAVVMESDRGRTDKVSTFTNVGDFKRVFGGGSTPAHTACNYLLSRGNTVKVVRCEPKGPSEKAASVTIPFGEVSEASSSGALIFSAKQEGPLNDYAIKLELVQKYSAAVESTSAVEELFSVKLCKSFVNGVYGEVIETFPIVSLQDGPFKFDKTINNVSAYISVSVKSGTSISTTTTMFNADANVPDVYSFDGFNPKLAGGSFNEPMKASADAPFYRESGSASVGGIRFTAVANGSGYNGIAIQIINQSLDGSVFSIKVYSRATKVGSVVTYSDLLEEFPAVSLDRNSQFYYGDIVKSDIIDMSVYGSGMGNLFSTDDRKEVGAIYVHPEADPVVMSGGAGGPWNKTDKYLEALMKAASHFSDEKVDITTAILPGYYGDDVWSVYNPVVNIRKDFVVLIDPKGSTVNAVLQEKLVRSSYVSYYFPMCKVPGYGVIQASVVMAARIAAMHQNNLQYKAPAGIENGVLTEVIDTVVSSAEGVESVISLSSSEVSALQETNVNPLVIRSDVGCVAWGQSCSIMGNAEVTRLAVRLLANYFKRSVRAVSEQFIFADNNSITWDAWKLASEPILRDVFAVNGIRAYRVVCDSTTMTEQDIANGRLIGVIYFWPLSQVEKITVKFTIDETGVSFE